MDATTRRLYANHGALDDGLVRFSRDLPAGEQIHRVLAAVTFAATSG